jgi:rare lipoprotein A
MFEGSPLTIKVSVMKLLIIWAIGFALISGHVNAETGKASWYGHESGNRTANGEKWNPHGMTAATWFYPFNTKLRVTCLRNGKCVTVRVNDRGPARRLGRIIDLSEGAARQLGMLDHGVSLVKIDVIR